METVGFINEPLTQTGYGLSDDNQSTDSHLGSSVNEEKTNSIDDDDDDNVNVKSEMEANELEYVIEIDGSSDEEDMIDDPFRILNPKDVTHGIGTRSSLRLMARANDESNAQKPSCSKNAKRFNCKLCEYGSDHKGSLSVHMRTHNKEKPFRCSRCSKRFTNSSHLKSHMRTHNKPHRCSHCSKRFNQLQLLKTHMTTHKDRRLLFHCKGCFQRFAKESEKKAHEKGCRYRRYECDICKNFVTRYKSHMETHMRVHTGETPFRCKVCMKCFNQKGNLKKHMKNVHNRRNLLSTSYTKVQIETKGGQTETGDFINEPSAQAGYGLPDDDQSTSSFLGISVKEENINLIDDNVNVKWEEIETRVDSVVEKLNSGYEEDIDESQNYHLETKIEWEETDWTNDAFGNEVSHNNDEGNIDDDYVSLNDGYSTGNDVTNGNRDGSSSRRKKKKEKPSCLKPSKDSKRFKCIHCEYGTNKKGIFNRHIRTHTNEKPYRCSCCDKCFVHSSSLKRHMATHKNEFPFHCSNCFRRFIRKNEKESHEQRCGNHSNKYECYVCKYFTSIKPHLVRHMRTHSGNKPYRCSQCSKEFTQSLNLKIHMTTHKDKTLPFHCKGCFRRFPKESEKKDHEKDCRYRRYECDICKKYVTNNKTQMEIHMRSHTGEKPFRCEVCMKCFRVKSHLKGHLKNIHNKSNL